MLVDQVSGSVCTSLSTSLSSAPVCMLTLFFRFSSLRVAKWLQQFLLSNFIPHHLEKEGGSVSEVYKKHLIPTYWLELGPMWTSEAGIVQGNVGELGVGIILTNLPLSLLSHL